MIEHSILHIISIVYSLPWIQLEVVESAKKLKPAVPSCCTKTKLPKCAKIGQNFMISVLEKSRLLPVQKVVTNISND